MSVHLGAELTSIRSARISSARRLAKRAFRSADRRFLAEGPQAVREAVAYASLVSEVFVTAEAARAHPQILADATARGAALSQVSGEVMSALSATVTPQGIVAVVGHLDVPLDGVLAQGPRLVAVLSHVRDPGNAGTVLRAADAAGADAVVLTDASVDVYNPKCVRASAGSLFHLPVVIGVPLGDVVDGLRANGLRVLAADGTAAIDLEDVRSRGDLAGPTAWVFGNEAWGLPADLLALADEAVRVPIYGRAESLNLAAAAAVCLYATAAAHRQRSNPTPR